MHAVTQIHVTLLPRRVVQGCKCDRRICTHLLVDSSETCRYKAQLFGHYLLCHLANRDWHVWYGDCYAFLVIIYFKHEDDHSGRSTSVQLLILRLLFARLVYVPAGLFS